MWEPGMVATNSVAQRTGNVVCRHQHFLPCWFWTGELRRHRPEVELVVGPDRSQVAMAHCNNCTSDLNALDGTVQRIRGHHGHGCKHGRSVCEDVPQSYGRETETAAA